MQPSSHSGSDYGFEEEDEARYLESIEDEIHGALNTGLTGTNRSIVDLIDNRMDHEALSAANAAQFDWNSFMNSVLNFSVDPLRDDPHDFPVGETSIITGLLPAAAAAAAAAAATSGGTDLASELQLDKQITMSVLHSTQQTKKQSRFQNFFDFEPDPTESEPSADNSSHTTNTFTFLAEPSWPFL